jgi:copper transport protein
VLRTGRRRAVAWSWRLLWALALAGVTTGVAWAHPVVVRSEPAANSTVQSAPRAVSVWFNEPIEPDYGNLAVYDTNGLRVDNFDTRYTPGPEPSLTVTLPELPQGSYLVTWRAFSVGDGHSVGGAFSYGVGVPPDVDAAAAANQQAQALGEPDETGHLIRWLGLLAQLVLVGALAFRVLVWRPAVSRLPAEAEHQLAAEHRRFASVLADVVVAGLVVGVLGALYVQARATGVYFWELFGTRWGAVWVVRLVAALWASLWLEGLLEDRRPAWVGALLALALLLTTSLASHSSAQPGLLGPLADLVHQLAAGVWTGGLVMLALSLLALGRAPLDSIERPRLAAEWVARFSGVAAASVGVILASGLLLATREVSSWAGLLLTSYGQTLLAKLAVVVVALALGAYNALSLPRRAARGGRSAGWVALEAAAVAGVVFVTARIVDLPPAAGPDTSASGQSLVLAARSPGPEVTGRIQPARLGTNVFEVTVTDAGQPVRGAQVALTFQPVGGSGLTTELPLVESSAGDGRYAASGGGLARTGPWQILVTIRRAGEAVPAYTTFDLDVGVDQVVRAAGTPLPVRVRALDWLNHNGWAALSLLVLAVAAGWGWLVSRSIPGGRRAGLLTIGLLLAALFWILLLSLRT